MVQFIGVPLCFLLLPGVVAVTLLNGRFETTSDVQDLLDLALDAAAMREATTMAAKAAIYQNVGNFGYLLIPKYHYSHKVGIHYFREQKMKTAIFRKWCTFGCCSWIGGHLDELSSHYPFIVQMFLVFR